MGKAALILVLAAGIAVAYGALSNQETGYFTAKKQANYEETILAREIARSGFNAAMSILRQHGDNLLAGVNAINGEAGYLEGQSQGGVYRAHAQFISGHTVEVSSVGYFGGVFDEQGAYQGGASYTIDDNFTHHLPRTALHVSECAELRAQFVRSGGGSCAAVYLQRHVPGLGSSAPELLFPSGTNRDGAFPVVDKKMLPGTQMNLFIGVDPNCSQAPANWQTYDHESHVFVAGNYSHVHHALDTDAATSSGVKESIWALIEQHPADNQRWRIAWESTHSWNLTNPNHGHYHDPTRSIMGLKMYGYDGLGWPTADAMGYRQLQTHSGRPDLNDQVLEVRMIPTDCSDVFAGGGDPGDNDDDEAWTAPPISPSDVGGHDQNGNCLCPGASGNPNHKVAIRHFPPGNPENAQIICVSENAWPAHRDNHGDVKYCVGP